MSYRDLLEQLLDENNNENILLYSERGQVIEFEQVAVIPLKGRVYAILHPVEALPGMSEEEALVFCLKEDAIEPTLELETDDAVVDQVFEIYDKLLEEEGVDVD